MIPPAHRSAGAASLVAALDGLAVPPLEMLAVISTPDWLETSSSRSPLATRGGHTPTNSGSCSVCIFTISSEAINFVLRRRMKQKLASRNVITYEIAGLLDSWIHNIQQHQDINISHFGRSSHKIF